jgi:HAD superfamily hydrolase (TIGR01509 family)
MVSELTHDEAPVRLVIFDFDGVIADSEIIALEELAAEMTARGAAIGYADAKERFLGASTREHMAFITEQNGTPCSTDFPDAWHARLYARFARELQAVPGAVATLDELDRLGLRYCIASGGAPARLQVALHSLGLTGHFGARVFSAEMVARGKPAPDLFVFAAAQMQVAPEACVVVEDATAGVRGACAAGMRVVGFTGGSHLTGNEAPHAAALQAAGAQVVVQSHAELRQLLSAR